MKRTSSSLYGSLFHSYSTIGISSITETFFIVEMFNQNINDLLSFGVFLLINEFVGLEFD